VLVDLDFDDMLDAVVDEWDRATQLLQAIDDHGDRLSDFPSDPLHGKVVKSVVMAVVKLERRPGAGQPRTPRAIGPPQGADRASVSTISRYIQPADPVYQLQPPAPDMRRDGVDVGDDDVRLDFVAVDLRQVRRVTDWV